MGYPFQIGRCIDAQGLVLGFDHSNRMSVLERPQLLEAFGLLERAYRHRGVAEQEIPLIIQQVSAGLMTPNEGRRKLGLDTVTGGDELRAPTAPAPSTDSEPETEGVPA